MIRNGHGVFLFRGLTKNFAFCYSLIIRKSCDDQGGILMKDRPGVMFYFENQDCINALTDEECGKLTKGIMEYAKTGEEPTFDSVLRIVWLAMRPTVDRDGKRYERQCSQKQYAVYCREQDRRGEPRRSYEDWYEHQLMNGDAFCYPNTTANTDTNANTNTNTNTDTTANTTTYTNAAANATVPISEAPPADEEKQHFGQGRTILLTKTEFTDLMNEIGLTRLHEVFLYAEPLAQKRGYDPDTLNWPQFLRFCHKNKQKIE